MGVTESVFGAPGNNNNNIVISNTMLKFKVTPPRIPSIPHSNYTEFLRVPEPEQILDPSPIKIIIEEPSCLGEEDPLFFEVLRDDEPCTPVNEGDKFLIVDGDIIRVPANSTLDHDRIRVLRSLSNDPGVD